MFPPLVLGWEEWVALPSLALPAIRAKVDTGAKTSALHATGIERLQVYGRPIVRFIAHPAPERDDIAVLCEAPLVDERQVASSNGVLETRAVIQSMIAIAGRTWAIELTLTDRSAMRRRMLIGRQAISDDVLVDPSSAFRQPKLSYALYRGR